MTRKPDRRIHDALDGLTRPPAGSAAEAEVRRYEGVLGLLGKDRVSAPPDLADQIMDRLPARAGRRFGAFTGRVPVILRRLGPFLAGAAAVLVGVFAFSALRKPPEPASAETIEVHFELHAPGAERVALVGTFNHWQPGAMLLTGPDASGHWSAKVSLPAGRYEYQFLVDGREWVTDPEAAVLRPDGFGNMNAILSVAGEGTRL